MMKIPLLLLLCWPILGHAKRVPQNTEKTLLAPSLNKRFLVVLDAGHGGKDCGAIRAKKNKPRLYEKDISLRMARKIKALLENKGVPVILTRSEDETVSLEMRSAIANRAQATLFVSLHINASANQKDEGVQTFVLNTATNSTSSKLEAIENRRFGKSSPLDIIFSDLETSASTEQSMEFAKSLQQRFYKKHLAKDQNVRKANFYILMKTHMPSVLLELGFLSGIKDSQRLTSAAYLQQLATLTANTIVDMKAQWKETILGYGG